MNIEALGPARHIQSALAARLDQGYFAQGENDAPEVAFASSVDGRPLFAAAVDGAEASTEERDSEPQPSIAFSRAPSEDPVRETLAEVRRLLEDREEELSLELRLQQTRHLDDPGRTIQLLNNLRRDVLATEEPGQIDYLVASEVTRELVSARLKKETTEDDEDRAGQRAVAAAVSASGTVLDQPSPVGSGHSPQQHATS